MAKYRPIHHVHITDDLTGELLADVDAVSAADALAYFLRSRNIDPDATEAGVKAGGGTGAKVLMERRNPFTQATELALLAEVVR